MNKIVEKNQKSFLEIFICICLVIFQVSIFKLVDIYGQTLLGVSSILLFLVSIYIQKKHPLLLNETIVLIAQAVSALIVIFLIWNYCFLNYIRLNDFHADVFRDSFENFTAPVYGREKRPHLAEWAILLIPFFIVVVYLRNAKMKSIVSKNPVSFFFLTVLVSILLYSILNGTDAFFLPIVHYKTYALGLSHFSSLGELLKNYSARMHELGVHNSHYPPGNLLLLKTEELLGLPGLSKLIVIVFTALSVIPMNALMNELSIKGNAKIFSFVAFSSFSSIVIFSNIDPQTLVIFFSTSTILFFIKAIRSKNILFSIIFGMGLSLFTFFSFVSSVMIFFIAIYSVFLLITKEIKISNLVMPALISVSIFVLLYSMIYFFTGFTIYECFTNAVQNNRKSMSNGFDTFYRYFLRSTGNLLAYLISLGFIHVGLFLIFVFKKENLKEIGLLKIFSISIALTLFLSSFSGLFFLETERIWVMLAPLLAIVTGSQLYLSFNNPEQKKSILIILFAFLISISQQLYFNHYV